MSNQQKGGSTVNTVWQLAEPLAASLGLSIWDVRFVKEGAEWFLRIFIDKPGGVFIDDCEAFSNAIDPVLDEADPISQSYYLEVSSPGVERELSRDFHFEACMGQKIRIRLIRPQDGRREFIGMLAAFDSPEVTLREEDGNERRFSLKEISRCRIVDDTLFG